MHTKRTGRTTQQMTAAPRGAVFVWGNENVYYPRSLAKALGRDDLVVRPMSWLEPHNFESRDFPGVVVDHAALPGRHAAIVLNYLRARGVPVSDQ